jgi:uncharacterized protein with HEPN domain
MPHDPQTLLEDVRRAAQMIVDFTSGKSVADYTTDVMLHAAVEREFIIIGEALSRLEKLDAALAVQIMSYRQIIGFRNVLVHGYDAIDDQIVWRVIEQDLPILKQQAETMLIGLGPP